MELQILEVSQVNAYIKGLFDRDARGITILQ